jgi:hypothetical protein
MYANCWDRSFELKKWILGLLNSRETIGCEELLAGVQGLDHGLQGTIPGALQRQSPGSAPGSQGA